MSWLRRVFLGKWRIKGVALFFAVTIWYVAYHAEKQEYATMVRVEIGPSPADKDTIIITSIRAGDPQTGAVQDFDNRVRLVFSGPRKQIERLRVDPPSTFVIEAPRGKELYTLEQADFGFPRDGVEITQFNPAVFRITQDEVMTTTVMNMAEKVTVSHLKEGYEVASKEVIPSSVQITGPRSIVENVSASANVSMEYSRERFDGKVDVVRTHPDGVPADLLRRTVKVKPPEVRVSVVLKASADLLPVDAVRVSFRIPPVKIPVRIVLDDIVGDTIPVEFHGRKDEIGRLRDRLRDQPGFSLGVRVPVFDRETGGQFTFTEDSLELYGFPGVQIRQHEIRRSEKKTAWSYTVTPVKEPEK